MSVWFSLCLFLLKQPSNRAMKIDFLGVLLIALIFFSALFVWMKTRALFLSEADDPLQPVKFPAPTCKELLWVHPPKTSSSFCLTIQHVCCKAEFEAMADLVLKEVLATPSKVLSASKHVFLGWGCLRLELAKGNSSLVARSTCFSPMSHGHRPMLPESAGKPTPLDLSRVAMMLRDPRQRILSAFFDGMHAEGMSDSKQNAAPWRNASLPITSKILAYSQHPDIIGCQVKMLNGLECAAPVEVNQSLLDTAKKRLRKLFFVGIFEEYSTSLERFHRDMGHGTKPHAIEMVPSRSFRSRLPLNPSRWSESDFELNSTYSELSKVLVDYVDPWDSVLYREAVALVGAAGKGKGKIVQVGLS